jgi:hypothetical protein
MDDFGMCQQRSGEFGSSGCADVTGTVVGLSGQPLGGVDVGLRETTAAGLFAAPFVQTDAQGQFRLRLTRVAPPGLPDTVTVTIGAAVRPVLPQTQATATGAAEVLVTVVPIGRVPVAARISIALPVR